MVDTPVSVSVLNLGPIRQGQGPKEAIDDMVRLAQAAEELGYKRYWIAEHHNTPTLVSAATVILIKHTLEHTKKIRVGSGGIMLPNHSPLVVAEQFGTMAHLYPDRLDLGLGRAPGTDMLTASVIRRSHDHDSVHSFPKDIQALLRYFGPEEVQGYVKANIAIGTQVPLYILGSTPDSAVLAAKLGLPYAFASHFAPFYMEEAIEVYRREFQPSQYLADPYMIVCLNVIAAESDEEAMRELTTMQQLFLNISRGEHKLLAPPIDNIDQLLTPQEKAEIESKIRMTFVGSKESIRQQFTQFQAKYNVDEIMAVTYIYDQDKQIRSYQIFKEVVEGR